VKLAPPILVETPQAWQECLARLQEQDQLAIDMESNGLYAYQEQVCLIQISIPNGREDQTSERPAALQVTDYILDPLRLPDLDGLGKLMADPKVEKVFHAAEYDILSMKRDFDHVFHNLFDTMLAARILGWRQLGLASILEQEYGVELDKRFQRANWGRRPLPPEQISYARMDTHYLLALRDRLQAELESKGRLREASESFERLAAVTPTPRSFDPDEFWQLLNGRRQLSPQQNAVLRQLYIFRDQEAQRRNRPPFKVFGNRTLVEVAEALPLYHDELQGIHGMSIRQIRRYGRQLVEVVRQGLRAKPPAPPPRHSRPPEAVLGRYDALHTWRKKRARQRGVESDVICAKDALWELAHKCPKTAQDLKAIQSLGDWQRDKYGEEILGVIEETRKGK
jgi:ribonuclease D